MNSATSPVKVGTTLATLVLVTAAAWILRGYVWPTLSPVEVPAIEARIDPTLYPKDLVVQESLRFTPRYFYISLIAGMTRLGVPLPLVFAGLHLLALGAILQAVRSAARTLALGPGATAVLALWILTVTVGTVGGVYFYTHAPVPAVWAGAFAAWGGALALRSRMAGAYACFAGAVLFQFLVGFYAGLLALPFLLRRGPRETSLALGGWILALAAVYLPMRFSGSLDEGALDGRTFTEIYAFIRHPHHLVPSTWGWAVWLQAAVFYLAAWRFVHGSADASSRRESWVLGGAFAAAALAILANYVFVELVPVALVAKLQPARITPLVQVIFLAVLARRVDDRIRSGNLVDAALLAIIPLSPFPGFLLILATLFLRGPEVPAWRRALLAAAVLTAFQPLDPSIASRAIRYATWAGLFAVVFSAIRLEGRRGLSSALAGLAVATAAICAFASRKEAWPPFLAARFSVEAPARSAVEILGKRFAAHSPADALVLTPPGDDAWAFKLASRRSVVVNEKDFPFTDRGIREWASRLETVLGRPLVRGGDLELLWKQRSPDELDLAANRYGARYILVRDREHADLPGVRADTEGGWSIWVMPP